MKHTIRILLATLAVVTASIHANGNPVPKAAEPNAEKIAKEWAFPFGRGGEIKSIGIADGPIQTSIIDTRKSFGDVWTFYAKKIGSDKVYGKQRAYLSPGKTKDGRYLIRDVLRTDKRPGPLFIHARVLL